MPRWWPPTCCAPRRWAASRSAGGLPGAPVAGPGAAAARHAALVAADVLCAPSLGGESFGMVLTEAFAAGTPVVASDIAGYRDVGTHGEDGLPVLGARA